MLEMLGLMIGFLKGVLSSLMGLLSLVLLFVWDLLVYLHVEMPRLEGLLIGVGLAWLLSRRDRHPVLRVLSSPLRLVLDILDLAWDQASEVIRDSLEVVRSWVGGILGWCRDRVMGLWDRMMSGLRSARDRLKRQD